MDEAQQLIQAVAGCYEELPDLIGTDWQAFEGELTILMRLLESPDENTASVHRCIIELFKKHPKAYQRLAKELAAVMPERTRGQQRSLAESPAGSAKMDRYISVPVYFGTDRQPSAPADGRPTFSGLRAKNGKVSFGVAQVSIPDDHKMGKLEKPTFWKLQFRADPAKHVVLLDVEVFDEDAFAGRARKALAAAGRNEALVFVHGYNVDFDDALIRAAQVAYDLHFNGLTLAYSWPSEGDVKKYTIDEANIIWTRPHFKEFLRTTMTRLGVDTVHVIAHSMGNRALADIIPNLDPAQLPDGAARLREVIFTAPDIDAGTFHQLAAKFHGKAERFTLYASSNDKALLASKTVHKYARAGDAGKHLVVTQGLDTVDASQLDTSLMGHSYYGDNRSVVSDLLQLICHGRAPQERGLEKREKSGAPYWIFSA